MTTDLKTYRQWLREGRAIIKGCTAAYYRVDPDHTRGRALFAFDQTQPVSSSPDVDELEGWTDVVPRDEWDRIQAERRQIKGGPQVKVRRPEGPWPGVEVWCGPDRDLIALLRERGFTYLPASHYWHHPAKDPEETARRFGQGKIRGLPVRVTFDWPEAPQL